MLGVAKLFASILAGDWEEAGEALVDITKGAMQALTGVIAAGWTRSLPGSSSSDRDPGVRVRSVEEHRAVDRGLTHKMIDLINGFIEAANSVTEKVGISLPKLGRIHLQADKIEIPKLKIQRWSETSFSKEIDEFLKKDEEEEEEEEEDIDKEFEDEPEREPAPALPKSSLPVAPKPETPVAVVDVPEIPETEPPTIPDLPEPGVPESSPAPTPAFSLPIPVTVINWPAALRPVQAAPPAADERVEPVEEEEDIDKEFEDEPEREPAPALPKSQTPGRAEAGDPGYPPAACDPTR